MPAHMFALFLHPGVS